MENPNTPESTTESSAPPAKPKRSTAIGGGSATTATAATAATAATSQPTSSSSDSTASVEEIEKGVASSNFKVSDKALKGLDDIVAADSGDESLRRYKEQLLGTAMKGDTGDKSDPRQFVITEFRVMFAEEEKQADIVHLVDTAEGLAKLKTEGISMKEGAKFKFKISFRVQHEILVGIKFVNKLSKLVFSNSEELPLGSYGPSSEIRTFEFPEWTYSEAPSGMMFRGTYKANNSIVDGDGKNHLNMEYEVHIKKTW